MGFRALGKRQEIFEANSAHDLADSSRKPQPLRQVSVRKLAAVSLTTTTLTTGRMLLALAFCFWLT
ncbi:MAG: hypothetical protein KDE09_21380, partial [Anaerolineales bacterium]|nr:hypothetical protein [Anaerolineales bacterium]